MTSSAYTWTNSGGDWSLDVDLNLDFPDTGSGTTFRHTVYWAAVSDDFAHHNPYDLDGDLLTFFGDLAEYDGPVNGTTQAVYQHCRNGVVCHLHYDDVPFSGTQGTPFYLPLTVQRLQMTTDGSNPPYNPAIKPNYNGFPGWDLQRDNVLLSVLPHADNNANPTASFTYRGAGTPGDFSFTSTSTSPGGIISRYDWDFGDGTTLPDGGATPTHHFSGSAAQRTVTLKVTTTGGKTDTVAVTMHPALVITQVSTNPDPVGTDQAFSLRPQLRNDGPDTITAAAPAVTLSPDSVATTDGAMSPSSVALAPGEQVTFDQPAHSHAAGTATANVTASGVAEGAPLSATPRVRTFPVGGGVAASLTGPPTGQAKGVAFPVTLHLDNQSGHPQQVTPGPLTASPATGVTVSAPTPSPVPLATGGTGTASWSVTSANSGPLTLSATLTAHDETTGTDTPVQVTKTLEVAANDITVTTTGDEALPDASRDLHICDVDPNTDGNQCTLRAALKLASVVDSDGSSAHIGFAIPAAGAVPTIQPLSALPELTGKVTLDASGQPGGWVELSGSAAGPSTDGLLVTGGADIIRGLVINNWSGSAIDVRSGTGNRVVGNRIGTDVSGAVAAPNHAGISIEAADTAVGGTGGTATASCAGDCNLISGNDDGASESTSRGVDIRPGGSATIVGNYIGTDVTGMHAVPNGTGVVDDQQGGGRVGTVVLGGSTPVPGTAPGNLISGNRITGVYLHGNAETVVGNLIGENRAGSASLQPTTGGSGVDNERNVGVAVLSTGEVTVGGPTDADRNVIGGFLNAGVLGLFSGSHVTLDHDYVGTSVNGTATVPNGRGVVRVDAIRNSLVSGNTDIGVARAQRVTGNLIGTTSEGASALPNGTGVAGSGQVGGARPAGSTSCLGPCNLISGNLTNAVVGSDTVQGNFIGTTRSGTEALPNGAAAGSLDGAVDTVNVLGGPSGAAERGVCDLACNVISGNAVPGVRAAATVVGNVIGLGIDKSALPNHTAGVLATVGQLSIGGDGALGNVIADNSGPAISVLTGPLPTVRGNVMFGNSGGIVIGDLVTGRVPAAPRLSAVRVGNVLAVTGNVTDLVTGSNFLSQVDAYASGTCSSGAQGRLPLGHVGIGPITDGSWQISSAGAPTSLGYVTATSTESQATSPFADCVPISRASTITPTPGATDTVTGQGFTDGEKVKVELHSQPILLTTVTADADGVASAKVRIPASTPAGAHLLLLIGQESKKVDTIPITVTPVPQAGLLHLRAPTTLGRVHLRSHKSLAIAGHGGVPRHGARHALVLVRSSVPARVDGHRVRPRVSTMLVLGATRAKLRASRRGTVAVTVLGWYAAARSTHGDVLRTVHPSVISTGGALVLAGTRGLPYAGLDGVALTVRTPHASSTFGGLVVPRSVRPQRVVVRVSRGVLAVHLARGARYTVTGWYGGPAAAPGGVTTG